MTIEQVIQLLIGGGAIAGAVELVIFFVKRHDSKKTEEKDFREYVKKEISDFKKGLFDSRLESTRHYLQWMMKDQPRNHDAILRIAERYFIDYDGNAEVFSDFVKWKNQEGVDISWFQAVLQREQKK